MFASPLSPARGRFWKPAAAALLMLIPLLSACGGDEPATDSAGNAKLAITFYDQAIVSLPVYVAAQKGIWADHGLDVETVPIQDGATGVSAVQSGDADLTVHYTEAIMQANEKGADLRAVVGVVGGNTTDIVVGNDVDIADVHQFPATIKELSGLTLGVTAVGGYTDLQLRALFDEAGVSEDDYTIVGVGLPQVAINALKAGKIDAYVNVEPAGTLATDVVKVGKRVFNFGADVPQFQNWLLNVYAGREDNLSKKADAISDFQAAWADAVAYIQDPANHDDVVAMTAEFMKLDPAVAGTLLASNADSFASTIDPADIKAVSDFYVDRDQLSDAVEPDDFVWSK